VGAVRWVKGVGGGCQMGERGGGGCQMGDRGGCGLSDG
jgi:hypothetical protein